MRIIFYPAHNNINDSIKLLTNCFEQNGIIIVNKEYTSDISLVLHTVFSRKVNRPKVMHLNWIEDNAAKNGIKSSIKCFCLLSFFKLYKKLGGRIVWTLHNAKCHDEGSSDQTRFISKFLKLVDEVVIHAKESQVILEKYGFDKSKILYVPLGNYDESMKKFITIPKRYIEHDKMNFFYFGTIAQYKGVNRLLEVFNDDYIRNNANLTIWGKPNKDVDVELLKNLANNNESINMHLDFIDNETLGKEFNLCDISVFPFNKESMQNSGSLIMSLTCSTPILVPKFGYVNEILDEDFVFSYDYDTPTEHYENLKNEIKDIINLWQKNPKYFIELGNKARDFAVEKLDWSKIAKDIVDMYKRICEEDK